MLEHIVSYAIIKRALKAAIAQIKKNPRENLIIDGFKNYK
jgi:hypothetical protein